MSDHLSRRRRGRQSELLVADYLRQWWPGAEAAPPSRPGEDVLGIPGVAWEVKSRRGLQLKAWTRQASQRDGLPILVIRSNGDGPSNVAAWTAAMPLATLAGLLREAGY